MGAETKWTVTVLVTQEETVDVYAVTAREAMEQAEDKPYVIRAVKAKHDASEVEYER